MWLLGAAVVAVVILLPLSGRAVATQTSSDSLWANAARSLCGSPAPFDLRVFVQAGDDVLHGRNPYVAPGTIHGPADAPYAYPPLLALLVTPLALLPEHVHHGY